MEKQSILEAKAQENYYFKRMIIALGSSVGSIPLTVIFAAVGGKAGENIPRGEYLDYGSKGSEFGFIIGCLVGAITYGS